MKSLLLASSPVMQAGICESSIFSLFLFLLYINDDTFHYHCVVPEYLSFTMNGFSLQEAVCPEHFFVQTHPRSLDASKMVRSLYHSSKYFVMHADLSLYLAQLSRRCFGTLFVDGNLLDDHEQLVRATESSEFNK